MDLQIDAELEAHRARMRFFDEMDRRIAKIGRRIALCRRILPWFTALVGFVLYLAIRCSTQTTIAEYTVKMHEEMRTERKALADLIQETAHSLDVRPDPDP